MSPAEKIRIEDLRSPVLTDMQKGLLAHGEANPVELTRDAVLAAAVEATGLSDFGPDDFHERLDLMLSETDADPLGCTASGGSHRIGVSVPASTDSAYS